MLDEDSHASIRQTPNLRRAARPLRPRHVRTLHRRAVVGPRSSDRRPRGWTMNDATYDANGSPVVLSEQGQQVRERFEAACQTWTGGSPPNLDSFLRDAPLAERNVLRPVLESIQQNSLPCAGPVTVAW